MLDGDIAILSSTAGSYASVDENGSYGNLYILSVPYETVRNIEGSIVIGVFWNAKWVAYFDAFHIPAPSSVKRSTIDEDERPLKRNIYFGKKGNFTFDNSTGDFTIPSSIFVFMPKGGFYNILDFATYRLDTHQFIYLSADSSSYVPLDENVTDPNQAAYLRVGSYTDARDTDGKIILGIRGTDGNWISYWDAFSLPAIGSITSEMISRSVYESFTDYSKYANPGTIFKGMSRFMKKWFTQSQTVLNVVLTGQSLSDFQVSEWTPPSFPNLKTDRTVEPNGLYGNTFGRMIWRLLNYGVWTEAGTDPEGAGTTFANTITAAWGNMRFVRLDKATGVSKTGTWHYSGEGYVANSIAGKFCGTGIGFGTALVQLGGWNDTFDATYYSNDPYPYTKVYFFTKDLNNAATFTVPSGAIGFSVVCYGRKSGNFDDNAGNNLLPSNNVEVKLNGSVIDTIDLTSFNGQKHFDYVITGSSTNTVIVTNKVASRWMNLWGLEYWNGPCVRVINNAFSATGPDGLFAIKDYIYVNDNPDLIILDNFNRSETTALPTGQYNLINDILVNTTADIIGLISSPIITAAGIDKSVQTSPVIAEDFCYTSMRKVCGLLGVPTIDLHQRFIDLGAGTGYSAGTAFASYFKDPIHLSRMGQAVVEDILKYVFRMKNPNK